MRASRSSILDQSCPSQSARGGTVAIAVARTDARQSASDPLAGKGGFNPEESDARLMERYGAGDHCAFETLYARYRAPLFRFLARLSSNDEAEEIYQEVWTAVIHHRRSYRPKAKFSTYLFSIAHRRLQDRWRRSGRRATAFDESASAPPLDEIADQAAVLPENWIQNVQLRDALLAAIDALPRAQREVFLLKAEMDLSLEEIAAATGAGLEATKSRLRYAVARLRSQLGVWK